MAMPHNLHEMNVSYISVFMFLCAVRCLVGSVHDTDFDFVGPVSWRMRSLLRRLPSASVPPPAPLAVMLRGLQSSATRTALSSTRPLRKKSGKPLETPDYKQTYLPYEAAPSTAELDRERRRFSLAPLLGYAGKKVPVKDLPANFFTYGKEGMSMPISIFKDQPDPVIAPEWTYPGIYENKRACKVHRIEELLEMQAKNSWPSPWVREKLDHRLNHTLGSMRGRMRNFVHIEQNRYLREKGTASKSKKTGTAPTAVKADPDKKAAVAKK